MVRAVIKKLVFFHYDDGSRSGETVYSLLKSMMITFKVMVMVPIMSLKETIGCVWFLARLT